MRKFSRCLLIITLMGGFICFWGNNLLAQPAESATASPAVSNTKSLLLDSLLNHPTPQHLVVRMGYSMVVNRYAPVSAMSFLIGSMPYGRLFRFDAVGGTSFNATPSYQLHFVGTQLTISY